MTGSAEKGRGLATKTIPDIDWSRPLPQGTLGYAVIIAVIGGVVALLLQRFGPWLLMQMVRPFRALGRYVWNWIAPRNPFSLSIRKYRQRVGRADRFSKIENPLGPVPFVPMDRGFAPLKLVSGARLEAVDLFDLAEQETRMLVLGGAGSGKSTLVRNLVGRIARFECPSRCAVLPGLHPAYVVLRDLAQRNCSVQECIVAAFREHGFPGAEEFVNQALDQGRMLVVLDGLDEVGANRPKVAAAIEEFCRADATRETPNRVIVTCRESSYRVEDLREVIPSIARIEPFTPHHMKLFLRAWPTYRGRSTLSLYAELQQVPEVRECCRNPLLLSLLAGLHLMEEGLEIPRSRGLFYQKALHELIVARPGRRHIVQEFDEDQKLRILQRAALEQLEMTAEGADTEVFGKDQLLGHARGVLQRDFNEDALVKELVHIDGVLREVDQGRYAFPHRTIQEYLAAREAKRTRNVAAILETVAGRDDLFELLTFYCSVHEVVPDMLVVLDDLQSRGDFRKAAACLVNMAEVPPRERVDAVVDALFAGISSTRGALANHITTLEVLSALAQRQGEEFRGAHARFSAALELFTTQDQAGAHALESVLAAHPEEALRLVPGLLESAAAETQELAVRVLRSLGSDEALDLLLLQLRRVPCPARTEAARVVAGLLRTRRDEILTRAEQFPERRDARVWPLEEAIPGRLVLPLVESLPDDSETEHPAINAAGRAYHALRGTPGVEDSKFLKYWEQLPRDIGWELVRSRLLRVSTLVVVLAVGALGTAAWSANSYLQMREEYTIAIHDDFSFHKRDVGALVAARDDARIVLRIVDELLDAVRKHVPPNASGAARILPSNWRVEPVLPEKELAAYEALANIESEAALVSVHRETLLSDVSTLTGLTLKDNVVSIQLVERIERFLLPALARIPDERGSFRTFQPIKPGDPALRTLGRNVTPRNPAQGDMRFCIPAQGLFLETSSTPERFVTWSAIVFGALVFVALSFVSVVTLIGPLLGGKLEALSSDDLEDGPIQLFSVGSVALSLTILRPHDQSTSFMVSYVTLMIGVLLGVGALWQILLNLTTSRNPYRDVFLETYRVLPWPDAPLRRVEVLVANKKTTSSLEGVDARDEPEDARGVHADDANAALDEPRARE